MSKFVFYFMYYTLSVCIISWKFSYQKISAAVLRTCSSILFCFIKPYIAPEDAVIEPSSLTK